MDENETNVHFPKSFSRSRLEPLFDPKLDPLVLSTFISKPTKHFVVYLSPSEYMTQLILINDSGWVTPQANQSGINDSYGSPGGPHGPPAWTWSRALIEIICFTFGIIGIFGNSILVRIYLGKRHRKPTEILILCLGCLDLFYCVCNDFIQTLLIVLEFYPPGKFFQTVIDVSLNFLFTAVPFMSWLMILNITCNRYIAVCHAFKYQQIYTLRFARNVICAILTFTILISSPNFATRSYSQETIKISRKIYQGMRSALVVIVCTVMFVMYSRVIHKLREQSNKSMLNKPRIAEEETVCQPKNTLTPIALNPSPSAAPPLCTLETTVACNKGKNPGTAKSRVASRLTKMMNSRAPKILITEPSSKETSEKVQSRGGAIEMERINPTIGGTSGCSTRLSLIQINGVSRDKHLEQEHPLLSREVPENNNSGSNPALAGGLSITSNGGQHHPESDDDVIEVEHLADSQNLMPTSHLSLSTSCLQLHDPPRSRSESVVGALEGSGGLAGSSHHRHGKMSRISQAKINSDKRARKTTVTLWIVCSVFVGLNMPNAAIRIISEYTEIVIDKNINDISLILYTLSFAVNPFIYYFTNSAFKTDVRNLIPCFKPVSNQLVAN